MVDPFFDLTRANDTRTPVLRPPGLDWRPGQDVCRQRNYCERMPSSGRERDKKNDWRGVTFGRLAPIKHDPFAPMTRPPRVKGRGGCDRLALSGGCACWQFPCAAD